MFCYLKFLTYIVLHKIIFCRLEISHRALQIICCTEFGCQLWFTC